jgi:hypothetical protein
MTGIEFNFQLNNKECIKSGYILNEKYIYSINYDENIIKNYMLLCLDIYHKYNLLPNINILDIKIHYIYSIPKNYFYNKNLNSSINFIQDKIGYYEQLIEIPSEKKYDFFLNLEEKYFIFNNKKINIITSKL